MDAFVMILLLKFYLSSIKYKVESVRNIIVEKKLIFFLDYEIVLLCLHPSKFFTISPVLPPLQWSYKRKPINVCNKKNYKQTWRLEGFICSKQLNLFAFFSNILTPLTNEK